MTVVVRETKETNIRCELTRDTGRATVSTGQPFLDQNARRATQLALVHQRLQITDDIVLRVVTGDDGVQVGGSFLKLQVECHLGPA